MKGFACLLMGYIVGMINPAYIIGKLRGMDIREKGSGNAGASNAVMTLGKAVGIFTALFDIFKAFFVVSAAVKLWPDFAGAFPLTSFGCLMGHIFPALMGFRGGKGLACLGGIILSFDYRIFLILLAAEIAIVLITDYICFVPITASVAFTVIYAVLLREWVGVVLFAAASVIIFIKHMENLKRIHMGREVHFSYLWNTDKETERMKDILGEEQVEKEQEYKKKK